METTVIKRDGYRSGVVPTGIEFHLRVLGAPPHSTFAPTSFSVVGNGETSHSKHER
jgi:hypothetical protein